MGSRNSHSPLVADNQIYSTLPDKNVTAIELRNDAMGVIIHDNLIRGCGKSFHYTLVSGEVGSIIDNRNFYREQTKSWHGNPPTLRRRSHRYQGWYIHWENGDISIMEDFDPDSCIFTLHEPRQLQVGEHFTMSAYYADGRIMEERLIHNNLIV